jgi:hypothetical protein
MIAVPSLPRIYRPMTGARVLGWVFAFGIAFLGLAIAFVSVVSMASEDVSRQGLTVGLVCLVFAGVIFLLLRVKVEANDLGVEVVNYVYRRHFAWNEIERFEVGFAYWGVSLVPRSGPPIRLNAIQKSNLYHWTHRKGRADRAVEELNVILASRGSPPYRPDRASLPT